MRRPRTCSPSSSSIMISFLGVVIGGIFISMYLPMFDLISKIG